MPKRSHARRHTAAANLQQRLDKITGAKTCAAVIVESAEVPAEVFAALMLCPSGRRCPRCTDARARMRKAPTPPVPPEQP
jgi:hypothetical protein